MSLFSLHILHKKQRHFWALCMKVKIDIDRKKRWIYYKYIIKLFNKVLNKEKRQEIIKEESSWKEK